MSRRTDEQHAGQEEKEKEKEKEKEEEEDRGKAHSEAQHTRPGSWHCYFAVMSKGGLATFSFNMPNSHASAG